MLAGVVQAVYGAAGISVFADTCLLDGIACDSGSATCGIRYRAAGSEAQEEQGTRENAAKSGENRGRNALHRMPYVYDMSRCELLPIPN